MMPTTHNSSSSAPYSLHKDDDLRSVASFNEQQGAGNLYRPSYGMPSASWIPDHDSKRAGQGGSMTPTAGIFANPHNNLGSMSQTVNTDFLNLYKALARVGVPQSCQQTSAPAPEPLFISQPHEFSLGSRPISLEHQLSLEHQHLLTRNRQHNLGQRGFGSEMALPRTSMQLTNQFPSSLAQSSWYNCRYGDFPVAQLPTLHQPEAESTSCVSPSDFAFGKDLAAPLGKDALKNPKNPLKDPKHPLRALSAYNFFFRDERDRIVSETEGTYETTSDKKQELLEHHWYRDRTKKRRHRKTHGKIAFTELSKVISQRWKGLPQEVKSFYHDVAAEDTMRYNKEVDAQKGLQ